MALALMAMPAALALSAEPLVRMGTIALPDTSGRIDHMAVDLPRKRLFVAELGNGSVDVIDLASGKIIHRIAKLDEPQGVAYVAKTDRLAVASGGDGTLRFYDGSNYAPRGVLKLGDDADNIRLGPGEDEITVGYGSGALAIVDTATAQKIDKIALAAHPESFQLLPKAHRAFVNVPDADEIAIIDLERAKQIGRWSPRGLSSNFPMAFGSGNIVAVVFRGQSKLVTFDASSGDVVTIADTCGDADDIFFDTRRQRFYVSCGAGFIDVFKAGGLSRVGHIATARGARTSLYVPKLDRFYVAARACPLLCSGASILIYRPTP
jgi:DNA-binding beta-propeller fold protein YncE